MFTCITTQKPLQNSHPANAMGMRIHLSACLFVFETCGGMRRTAGCVCMLAFHYPHHGHHARKFTQSKQEMHLWHFSRLLCFCFYFWKLICHKMFEPLTKRLFKKFHQSIHFESCKHSVTRTWLSCVLENRLVKYCLLVCRYLLKDYVITTLQCTCPHSALRKSHMSLRHT